MPLPCPSGLLPNWTVLDIRRASPHGTLQLILLLPLPPPKKKKRDSSVSIIVEPPWGLRSKKKIYRGEVEKKSELWRQWGMLIANYNSLRYDGFSFISELRCRRWHMAAIDMPHPWRTEPTSGKIKRYQPLHIYFNSRHRDIRYCEFLFLCRNARCEW